MRLNALIIATVVFFAAPLAQAQSTPDPVFGDDPHAKAVLDCHADYARRFANAITTVHATPTEIATAAHANCISQFFAFSQAVAATAALSEDPEIFLDRAEYRSEQIAKMRDYSFAYTLNTYLKSTTAF